MKKYLPPELIINRLKSKGMLFSNEEDALFFFERNNYYRFKSYFVHMLLNDDTDVGRKFQTEIDFDLIKKRYEFDNLIRSLCLDETQNIELTLRERIISILSKSNGTSYLNPNSYFDNTDSENTKREKTSQLNIFKRRLNNIANKSTRSFFNKRPIQLWGAVEISQFGSIIALIKIMKKDDKIKIAKFFGYESTSIFISHLDFICGLRNKCAHHEVLWQHKFVNSDGLIPIIPSSWGYVDTQSSYLYNIILIMAYIDEKAIKANGLWKLLSARILTKIAPEELVLGYGFSENWTDDIKQIREYISEMKE